jgi:hypothetical protein
MNNFVWHVLYKSLNRNNFDNSVNEKWWAAEDRSIGCAV